MEPSDINFEEVAAVSEEAERKEAERKEQLLHAHEIKSLEAKRELSTRYFI